MYSDNQSAIDLEKKKVYRARTKYIYVTFHMIRELISFGELLLKKVHTSKNAVDMLTNLFITKKFKHCLDLTNVFSF